MVESHVKTVHMASFLLWFLSQLFPDSLQFYHCSLLVAVIIFGFHSQALSVFVHWG